MPSINAYYHSWEKRCFDIVLGTLLFVSVLPILGLAALWVLSSDGGPVMFKQKRVGKNKQSFTILKIRTMIKDAEKAKKKLLHLNQAPSPMFKIFNDPRFIKGGRFLSATGIDELPQLLNVIKGEMSLVGPRPLPVAEANKLDKSWQFRFQVKPGLFSEWTADERRHKSLKDWKQLEMNTLHKNPNLFNDLNYLIKTVLLAIKNSFH